MKTRLSHFAIKKKFLKKTELDIGKTRALKNWLAIRVGPKSSDDFSDDFQMISEEDAGIFDDCMLDFAFFNNLKN
jgi:hypothetical protein